MAIQFNKPNVPVVPPLYGLLVIVHCGIYHAYGPLLAALPSSSVALLTPRAVGRYEIVVGELTMLSIISGF
jgi:hypothetical protein